MKDDYTKYTVSEVWGRFANKYIITNSKFGWCGSVAGAWRSRDEAQNHLNDLINNTTPSSNR